MGRGRGRLAHPAARRRPVLRKQTRSAAWRWDHDDHLEAELRRFTAGRTSWPTRRDFATAQRSDLYCAVTAYGGLAYWADRLGLTLSPRQLAKHAYPTAVAVEEARGIIESLGRLPGPRRLRELGYGRLATAVKSTGGSARFRSAHEL